jgi:hypothetical protein
MRAKCFATPMLLFGVLGALSGADASGQGETAADAGRHFRHGVELYGEANYSGALVEFKRAYALAPTSVALYDVGETEFQLQDYAAALKVFRQFSAAYTPSDGHWASVQNSIQVLGARVGLIRVTTHPVGADVTLDDEAVGKTPLGEPLLASIGRRKVVASMPGRPPTTQYVELAAGDDVVVSLELSGGTEVVVVAPPPESPGPPASLVPARSANTPTLRTIGWIAASSFAAGWITFGALAIGQADALSQARSELTTGPTLNHHANLTTIYGAIADSMGALAVLTGGVTVYLTLVSPKEHPHTGVSKITIGPASAFFETNF